jgi:hypothetical protein
VTDPNLNEKRDDLFGERPANDDADTAAPETAKESPAAGAPASIPATGQSEVSFFDCAMDKQPKRVTMTLPRLRDVLHGALRLVPVSNAEKDTLEAEKTKQPAVVFGTFKPGRTRSKADVEALTAYVIDLDGVTADDCERVFGNLCSRGVAFLAWTTWSNGWAKDGECWRIVVPFTAPVAAQDWAALWLVLNEALALGLNDKSTKNADRLWFLPGVPAVVPDTDGGQRDNEPPRWRENDGARLDPAQFLLQAPAAAPLVRPALTVAALNRATVLERAWTYVAALDPAISGQAGHDTAMGCVGRVVRGFDLTADEAQSVLSSWNARCHPPWSPAELGHKIDQALRTPDPQGREAGWLLRQDRDSRRNNGWDDDLDVGDLFCAPAANDDGTPDDSPWTVELAQAREDLEAAKGTSAKAYAQPCDFTSFGELIRKTIPPLSWLVQGLITQGAITALSGEPKTAKTWLAIELAVTVALGDRALGEFACPSPGTVALFLTEDHEANVRARLRGTVRGHGIADGREPPIHVKARGTLDLSDDGSVAWLIASARRLGPLALLVIDPLRNTLGSLKEGDNDDMGKVSETLRAIRDVLGCAVIYVHHTAKQTETTAARRPGQRMRGASALHGSYDAGIHLSAPAGTSDGNVSVHSATVEVEVKAGKAAAPFSFDLRIHDDAAGQCETAEWVFQDQRRQDAARAAGQESREAKLLSAFEMENAAPEMPVSALAKLVGGNKSECLKLIDRLIADGRLRERAGKQGARLIRRADQQSDSTDSTCSAVPPQKGAEPQNRSDLFQNGSEPPGTAEPHDTLAAGGDAERDGAQLEARILSAFAAPEAEPELTPSHLARFCEAKRPAVRAAADRLVAKRELCMRMGKGGAAMYRLPSPPDDSPEQQEPSLADVADHDQPAGNDSEPAHDPALPTADGGAA